MIHESATRLLPSAFRSSQSYTTFIQQSLNFLMHDIGGVRSTEPKPEAPVQNEAYLARKAVGGLLDFAALTTLHLSPMTLLAVVSDLAYGSSEYLKQVAAELEKQGIIDDENVIEHTSDLLAAIRKASGGAVRSFDQPPLNVAALEEMVDQTRQSLQAIEPTRVLPQAEIKRLWNEMEELATASNASMMDVSATASLMLIERMQLATHGMFVGARVAGGLVNQHVLQHYSSAFGEIRREGLYATLSKATTPYLAAVWTNFQPHANTWTEDLLSGRLTSRAWAWCKKSLGSKDCDEPQSPAATPDEGDARVLKP